MTETVEQEARRRMNEAAKAEVFSEAMNRDNYYGLEAVCRLIEEHRAFRKEVSDAVEETITIANKAGFACERGPAILKVLNHLIIPKPVDPLVEAMAEVVHMNDAKAAEQLRKALADRGYEITKKGDV